MPEPKAIYYVLDLDRTLFDTNKDANILRDVVAEYDELLAVDLKKRVELSATTGVSFSMHDFIATGLSAENLQRVEVEYMRQATAQDLLNPGARELLIALEHQAARHAGIMTYGSDKGQRLKLQASGLDSFPAMIVDTTSKGGVIAGWQQPGGGFRIPDVLARGSLLVDKVVLIDDRTRSFKDLPPGAEGYVVQPKLPIVDPLPDTVKIVSTLDEVRTLLTQS